MLLSPCFSSQPLGEESLMIKMSEQNFKQMQEEICSPEGTLTFDYSLPDLFNEKVPGGILLEIPSGQHFFRLERDNQLYLHYYHSSPGTGTRVATIDLKKLTPSETVFIAITWSPKNINLHFGPKVKDAKLVNATGKVSPKQFRIGKDGSIHQIGDKGVQVMGVNFYQGGTPVLQPTAIEAWNETIHAIDILNTGQSDQGYAYETVVTNLTLSILVTGFEAYTKKRFIELEEEGIKANTTKIIEVFYPKKERDAGIAQILKEEATEKSISILQYILNRDTINFQSFKKCKLAYNKGYEIKFGEISLSTEALENLQKYIQYRHKIIHVSANLGVLNQDAMHLEEPVFPSKETAKKAKYVFEEFIEKLHQTTLALRPTRNNH